MDVDVIVVGAGPTGLMLAGELRLAGARPLVLERQPRLRETPKANGFSGQILELLRYRGLLDRLEAASTGRSHPAPGFPFGGLHVDLTHLADPPLRALGLAQPLLERLLDERAGELGADIRRGQEVLGVNQDDTTVTADMRGPDGPYQMTAQYLVGCDGGRSRVRDMAGIPFPGTTCPEVNRLGQVTVPDSVTVLGDGDLDVPGLGRIRGGFTRTDRGVFALGRLTSGVLLIQTTEDGPADVDDDAPMSLTELQDSIRRVLGVNLPLGEPIRLSRYQFQARQAQRYRDGRILLAGDAAHQFPATGIGINAGMLDAVNLAWKLAAAIHGWAPTGLLDTYHNERHFAGERAMVQTQAQVALRRGHDPAAEALRELFLELLADEQPLRRMAALIAGTDIRYPLPNPNHHALTGVFAPDLTLRTDQGTTTVAELMRAARPILLDLASRPDLRETARHWQHRIDIHIAETDHRPADALLIRPDAHIAWAATTGEPADTAAPALREALSGWFGTPRKTAVPLIDRPS
ncbi:FAD-dependent monooxygenase [Amycolatopsis cynarae]|uniref:FAD-dependent monooxygenase n=1 Tax=Amycolatopsis cynarae TaxID=2995223 RepID=A0ABY7BBF6_9PSEU|nr:FAD-dependent monooxygenase [Amycolatopsis sp. HUAS 11-8]WAL69692.1 FAD-dependent monooxygenase [Amycolatopsis sp. HUAS 11-8]